MTGQQHCDNLSATTQTRGDLHGKENWEMFFNDDLTEIQAGEQRDLRALADYTKKLGHESIVKAGLRSKSIKC